MVQEVNPKDGHEALPAPPPTPEAEHQVAGGSATQGQGPTEEWREEFPYPWDEDEIMTRRDTLRFLVAGTGAHFLAGPPTRPLPVIQIAISNGTIYAVKEVPR